jgi:hypothetical protein
VLLVNGSHDNAIHDDRFVAVGNSIGSGGNGFFANPCTNSFQPFSPAEAPMGSGNTFTNVCYSSTDITGITCRWHLRSGRGGSTQQRAKRIAGPREADRLTLGPAGWMTAVCQASSCPDPRSGRVRR